VNKLSYNVARLPLKVYERNELGRTEARDSSYAALLRSPNPKMGPMWFWLWTASTFFIYGESLWAKVRGPDGEPRELWPLHPANVFTRRDGGGLSYVFHLGDSTQPKFEIPEADVVHFKTYNPDATTRGLSPLESLRMTLTNEDASRRASDAFWRNGARPSMYLSHATQLSEPAMKRLSAQWDSIHGGVDNFAKTAILEEGMEPHRLSLSAEESQYIESRKLNREECCIAYDVPPPAMHILDHATYSNITEQMRSVYRDTMAPKLGLFEDTLDAQLRPDFPGDIYGEFLMDEVLRGSFEDRMKAYASGIQFGVLQPAEARQMENRPFAEGSDRLFVNSTMVPIDEAGAAAPAQPAAVTQASHDPRLVAVKALGGDMFDIADLKSLAVTVKATETDNPNGAFEAILSTDATDREGESVTTGAFEPLPPSIPLYHQHDWMDKALPVGRGEPFYAEDGTLRIKGAFASTPRAQEVRTLVNEGVIDAMSVGYIGTQRKGMGGSKKVTKAVLLEGSFTAVPVNPTALVMASKALATKAGKRNSASDMSHIQTIHDASASLGADCAGAAKALVRAETKAVAGSYEDRQEDIVEAIVEASSAAIAAAFPDADPGYYGGLVSVVATFDDRVVYRIGWDDDDAWQASYTWDGEEVTLGTPEAVQVDQVVTAAPAETGKALHGEADLLALKARALRLAAVS
ncbi:MAG: phage portal protein, partial [Actinobacteria bacterium]|nr:phage portal protein [Actinomycetota bacterium]